MHMHTLMGTHTQMDSNVENDKEDHRPNSQYLRGNRFDGFDTENKSEKNGPEGQHEVALAQVQSFLREAQAADS